MPAEKINIDQFLELTEQHLLLDVRSPGEYNHAHIPGAYNLPLFTDEERAVVGTKYKQESRESAIKIGLDFFGPKMRKMVEEIEELFKSQASKIRTTDSRPILVYCWRGGMRSAAIAWLLDLYGYKVYLLAGGYKKFRNYVLDIFKEPFRLKILGGYTGSGKTKVLQELEKQGETIIDLEGLANHKGSAFGNIGLPPQPTQEMFENLMGMDLVKKAKINIGTPDSTFTSEKYRDQISFIWVEDESQRIGLVNIPKDFWNTMRRSQVCFLNIPFEERLKHLIEEYGSLEKQKMSDAILRIKERLGGLEAKNAINHLQEGNTRECFRILLKYYDKWYAKGLHNREGLNSLLHTRELESVTPLNAIKLIQQPEYHEKS